MADKKLGQWQIPTHVDDERVLRTGATCVRFGTRQGVIFFVLFLLRSISVYIMGGYSESKNDTIETVVFDSSKKSLCSVSVSNVPPNRVGHSAVRGNKTNLYLFGGEDQSTKMLTNELFMVSVKQLSWNKVCEWFIQSKPR
jgi:hypothetical protein